jgi:hypothetical protein
MNVLVRPFDPLNSHRLSHGQPKRQQQGAAHGRLRPCAGGGELLFREYCCGAHAVRPFRRAPSDVQSTNRQDLDFPDALQILRQGCQGCRVTVRSLPALVGPLSKTGCSTPPLLHRAAVSPHNFHDALFRRRGIGASRFTISVPQQQRTVGSEHAGSGARLVDGMDQIRKASAATSA